MPLGEAITIMNCFIPELTKKPCSKGETVKPNVLLEDQEVDGQVML